MLQSRSDYAIFCLSIVCLIQFYVIISGYLLQYEDLINCETAHAAPRESTKTALARKTSLQITAAEEGNLPNISYNADEHIPYDAATEIKKRRENLEKACQGQRHGIMSVGFRTNLVSRFGVSEGGIPFWTCFMPKAASSSLSASILLATGFFTKDQRNDITYEMWDVGRNKCHGQKGCLKEFRNMPQKYRYMDENIDEPFISLTFAREPMDRLVSAWRDKLYRREDEMQFYYERWSINILKHKFPTKTIPSRLLDAWDAGYKVEFNDFIPWVAAGNHAANEHWTPGSSLCLACNARFHFIGHKEHYSEDMAVLSKLLKVSQDIVPDSFKSINKHAAKTHVSTEEMFKDIPTETIQRIRQLYKPDYDIFGYEMPKWLRDA